MVFAIRFSAYSSGVMFPIELCGRSVLKIKTVKTNDSVGTWNDVGGRGP